MPRPLKKDACNTCRGRKVKCDGVNPVCGPCSKLNRYCDRSQNPTRFRPWQGVSDTDVNISENPREMLKSETVARLFHHYITEIAYWYDLSDAAQHFELKVPELALDEPLLFYAIIAVAALNLTETTTKSLKKLAQSYHDRCIAYLIALQEDDQLISNGRALAATCLLRSYEIFDGNDIDPNRHLWGVYSMASHQGLLTGPLSRDLLAAGFWNYLREDITFSLFETCPLKMNLQEVPLPISHENDQYYMNTASLVLGKVINIVFDHVPSLSEYDALLSMVGNFTSTLPMRMRPYSMGITNPGPVFSFPQIRFLRSCHAATFHYILVSLCILASVIPQPMVKLVEALDPLLGPSEQPKNDLLESWAQRICGIAFTSKSSTVLVNSFGPMAYSTKRIRAEPARDELRRQLLACKATVGWPVHRLIEKLEVSWLGPS